MGHRLDAEDTGPVAPELGSEDTELSTRRSDLRLRSIPREREITAESLDLTQTSAAPPSIEPEPRLEAGAKIARYLIIGTLGVGGMGVVHAAYDPKLDRKLALKLLRNSKVSSRHEEEIRARLLREAQAIAKLNHPNVVAVHDVGVHEGQVFVAMEFVDGGTLGDWMTQGQEPQPWTEVLARFLPAGRGLAAAHAAGLVHRDFKPANVLLGKDGRPRVADFGIARSVEGGDTSELEVISPLIQGKRSGFEDLLSTSSTLTRTGVLIGTPAYMAPEQFSDAHVDARADQFAFCVALYEALYGHRPFQADTLHALIFEIREGRIREPKRAVDVPAWLRKIVLRGLARDPAERWPDLDSLLTALEQRPRRWGRLAARLAMAVAVLASATAIAHGGSRARAAPVCAQVDDALAKTWAPLTRERVAARLDAAGGSLAESAPAVLERLDGWASAWRAGWTDACEATHVRAEQSQELLDLRMACLQRQRRRVDAYVALLGGRGASSQAELAPSALDGLDALVEELGDPRRCADTDALLAGVAAPSDEATRGQVEALSAGLDGIYALIAAGQWKLAETELEGLAPEVSALAWRPLSAEFTYLQAQQLDGTRELEASEAAYRQAFVDALSVGDERLAAKARRDLALLVAEWDSRHAEALEHLRVAEALALHRDDIGLRGSVALAQATVLELSGDFEAALAATRRSAAAMAEAHGPRSARLAEARYREAMADYRLGRIDEARAALDEARAGFGDDYGPTHPISLKMLNAAGVLAIGKADWDAAEQAFAELLARKQAIFGPDHLDVSDALSNLGAAEYNAGKLEQAQRSHQRALAIREAQMGPDNLYVGHSLANLAVVDVRLGQHETAEQAARRAHRIIAGVRGEHHHDTMVARSLIGEVLLVAGKDAEALVEFQAARALAEELGSPLQQLDFQLQVALSLVHLQRHSEAITVLDGCAELLQGDTVVPGQRMVHAYLRARIASERGDVAGAASYLRVAKSEAGQASSSGIGYIEEAKAWIDQHG